MIKIEVDNHKLMYHPERIAEWKEKGDCFPIYVEIGVTNRCNHKCMFCALDWLEHGGADIDSSVLCRNLEDMASHGVKSVMFAGEGEPLLHKDIHLFIKTAKESGMDVAMSSNGVLFKKERAEKILPYLSWIRFSVDAGTPETYSQLHGCRKEEFGKVLRNISDAADIKKKNGYSVILGTQALLTRISLSELCLLGEKVKELGADNIQIKPYSHHPKSRNDLSFDFGEAEKIRLELEELSTEKFQAVYRTQTIKRLCERKNYNKCYGLPFFALIEAKGNVVPCNFYHSSSEFTYGNINTQLFSEIWKSERRREIMRKIHEKNINACRLGCRLDAVNRYLHRIKNPYPHDNFI